MAVTFAKFTETESDAVDRIVARARRLDVYRGLGASSVSMDLAAVHAHTPLKLAELAEADDSNFLHDMTGIAFHLDRRTGELTDNFLPRYADLTRAA